MQIWGRVLNIINIQQNYSVAQFRYGQKGVGSFI